MSIMNNMTDRSMIWVASEVEFMGGDYASQDLQTSRPMFDTRYKGTDQCG